jgi:hypothetical protein
MNSLRDSTILTPGCKRIAKHSKELLPLEEKAEEADMGWG